MKVVLSTSQTVALQAMPGWERPQGEVEQTISDFADSRWTELLAASWQCAEDRPRGGRLWPIHFGPICVV